MVKCPNGLMQFYQLGVKTEAGPFPFQNRNALTTLGTSEKPINKRASPLLILNSKFKVE